MLKKKVKVLLCEDDPNLGKLLKDYLIAKDFEAELATDGAEGLKLFKRETFDFLILDVMMPVKDGFAVAKEVRKEDRHTPILFLTAKSMKEDTLEGFESGGDDYMTKPFSMEELVARIHAILRRSTPFPVSDEETIVQIGKYIFDYRKQKLSINGDEIKLTTKENELLFLLSKSRNGVLERSLALKHIWGEDSYFNGRSMDVYIAKIRKHLREDSSVEILNIHGKGFKMLTP